jgi:hypothetical protein
MGQEASGSKPGLVSRDMLMHLHPTAYLRMAAVGNQHPADPTDLAQTGTSSRGLLIPESRVDGSTVSLSARRYDRSHTSSS